MHSAKIGISTACLYPAVTEEALKAIAATGTPYIEIFFNSPGELEPDFIDKLKSILKNSNTKVVSIHPFSSAFEAHMLFSDYLRRFEDFLNYYGNYFRAASALGADILVIHGDRYPAHISDNEYIERFGRLAERGMEYGIRVAQENVSRHRSENPEFLAKMRDGLGDLAYFVCDFKQAVRSGNSPEAIINTMGDRLIHVHVNDNNSQSDCLLPGKGNLDFLQLEALINNYGTNPIWILEVYRRCFKDTEELKASADFLKGLKRKEN